MSSGAAAFNGHGSGGADAGDLQVIVSNVDSQYEVRLLGELDMSTAPQLRDELVRLASDGAGVVTLALSDLAFIDSTGLSVLITALKHLRQQGGDLALRSPTPGTRKVLEITGLTEVFSISCAGPRAEVCGPDPSARPCPRFSSRPGLVSRTARREATGEVSNGWEGWHPCATELPSTERPGGLSAADARPLLRRISGSLVRSPPSRAPSAGQRDGDREQPPTGCANVHSSGGLDTQARPVGAHRSSPSSLRRSAGFAASTAASRRRAGLWPTGRSSLRHWHTAASFPCSVQSS